MEISQSFTIYILSIVIFIFTFIFAISYKLFARTSLSSYLKCFAGGVILSTMIFHIFPDLYLHKDSNIAPLFSGCSFLLLFSIDKLYLYSQSNEADSLPEGSTQAQALLFVIALSMHSFLEGLGIPTKKNAELFWYMVGLLGHKWIEAFALGVSIMIADFKPKTIFRLLLLYSSLTPLGAIISSVAMQLLSNSTYFKIGELVMTGISSGSFFYIGFIEMLNSEFSSGKKDKKAIKYKMTAIFLGFILMTVVVFICDTIEKWGL
ncbi:Zinc transporter ZIP1 [Astathelohania contejeani]|uniref:Zinc transporter ZIP1 n=1 Tax=Astathelohania contejeani TaxID=164912 RepID=A0ABQ7HZR1_9MICR|nr:Zinc transporter ZIP1 [Thelohania contejeani]